jgi:sodium transport system permease protein
VEEREAYQTKIIDKEIELLIIFPQGFDQAIEQDAWQTPAPNVEIYFNSTSDESRGVFILANNLLENMKISNFDINRDIELTDLAPSEDVFGHILSSMFPLIILILVFSSCMAIGTESIAGEKERGTLATLLVTPTKRSDVAISKIISLGIIALLGGISSFLGIYFSLPRLMGISGDFTLAYSLFDYALLAMTVFTVSLLMVSLLSIVSAFAKSTKEANMAVMPLMMVIMLVAASAMFESGSKPGIVYYLIPLYNTTQSMSGILAGDFVVLNVLAAAVSNLIFVIVAAFFLAKMFSSERVMFSK